MPRLIAARARAAAGRLRRVELGQSVQPVLPAAGQLVRWLTPGCRELSRNGRSPRPSRQPPYVICELDDGTFEITVRAPRTDDDRCGADATMPIDKFALTRLVRELAEDLL